MKKKVPQLLYIAQLENKIVRLEANKKILLQIIDAYDDMFKTGIRKKDLPLLSETLSQQEKTKNYI